MSIVSIKHNNTEFATLTNNGSITLGCGGKIISDNIGAEITLEEWDGSIIAGDKPTNLTPSATYTGSVITNGYTTPTGVTMTGLNSGTNVGTYTATYTLNSGYCWSDGTTSSVTITLTINKATGQVTIAPTSTNATATTYQDVAICNAGSGTGTMYYSKDGSNYSTSIPTQNGGGGNVTIYYYAAESTNYTRSSVGSVSCYLYPDYLCFTANTASSTISITKAGSSPSWYRYTFEYSTDRVNWVEFVVETTTVTLTNAGDKVYFKGNNKLGVSTSSTQTLFTMTGSIAASGNIHSILDNGKCNIELDPTAFYLELNFACVFKNCTSLTTPPILPATTLPKWCYLYMFYGCTSLTVAPALPATNVPTNCYSRMFYNCTSLVTAPALPSTSVSSLSYYLMFMGCSSLTTPPALPATTLSAECYYGMFWNCTSLVVSDQPVSGTAEQAWTMPTSGTFTNTYSQSLMFTNCATSTGSRASNDLAGAAGSSYTYYTQNTPVS